MGAKVSREEFESFKKDVREDIEKSNTKRRELKKIVHSDFKEVIGITNRHDERTKKIGFKVGELNNAVKMLEPKIDELRQANDSINRISKELEEQTVRNIELRTRVNAEKKESQSLYDFIKKEGLEEKFIKFYQKKV